MPSGFQAFGSAEGYVGSGPAFNPPDIANLAFWYDSSLGVTQSGTVSAMADQSTNGRNLAQATSGKRPTFHATDAAFGGKPSVEMVAGSLTFLQASAFSLGVYTTFLVTTGLAGASTYFWTRGAASDDYVFGNTPGIFSGFRDGSGASAWGAGGPWGNFGATPQILRVQMDGTHAGHKGFLNGVDTFGSSVIGTDPGTGTVSSTLNIGDDGAGGAPASFFWAAFIGYAATLNAGQIAQVEAYLQHRFSL